MQRRPSSSTSPSLVIRYSLFAILIPAGQDTLSLAQSPSAVDFTDLEKRRILQHSPLPPLPPDPTNAVADDPAAARLGQFLFFEPGLSGNGTISCASCHRPEYFFADDRPLSRGIGQAARHTPSLLNAAYNRWYFWDGRADTIWSQALVPMENPLEMATTRIQVARLVLDDPALRAAYEKIFGTAAASLDLSQLPPRGCPIPEDPNHPDHLAWVKLAPEQQSAVQRVFVNVGKALAAYQRRLISRDAPFDRFAEGLRESDTQKLQALTPAAQRGLRLFVGKGECRLCHSGPNFTDGEFHNIRVGPTERTFDVDRGRHEGIRRLQRGEFTSATEFSDDPNGPTAGLLRRVLLSPETWGQFKTPSLRNVARTAPYMHLGQFADLRRVLRHYSTLEGAAPAGHHPDPLLQPRNLTDQEMEDLVAFLESLTGQPPPPDLTTRPAGPG